MNHIIFAQQQLQNGYELPTFVWVVLIFFLAMAALFFIFLMKKNCSMSQRPTINEDTYKRLEQEAKQEVKEDFANELESRFERKYDIAEVTEEDIAEVLKEKFQEKQAKAHQKEMQSENKADLVPGVDEDLKTPPVVTTKAPEPKPKSQKKKTDDNVVKNTSIRSRQRKTSNH